MHDTHIDTSNFCRIALAGTESVSLRDRVLKQYNSSPHLAPRVDGRDPGEEMVTWRDMRHG